MPDIEGVPYEAAGTALDVATAQALATRHREAASAGVGAANAAADRSIAASNAAKAEAAEAKALSQSVVAEVGTIRTAVVQSAASASAAAGSAAQAEQTATDLAPRVEHIETMAGLAPGEVTDAQTANLIARADTATRDALNAASTKEIVSRARRVPALTAEPGPLKDAPLSTATNQPEAMPMWLCADGKTVLGVTRNPAPTGAMGGGLSWSTDDGATWRHHTSRNPSTGARLWPSLQQVRDTDDGEVLVFGEKSAVTGDRLTVHKSSGWSVNPATATFREVLRPETVDAFWHYFSVDIHGPVVVCSEYPNQTGRAGVGNIYMSEDYGETWKKVFSLSEKVPIPYAHMHGVCYDPWWDAIWASNGDNTGGTGIAANWVSFDRGETWTKIESFTHQTTTIIALPTCILWVTDAGGPNAVYRIPRVSPDKLDPEVAYVLDPGADLTLYGDGAFRARSGDAPVLLSIQTAAAARSARLISTYDGYTFREVWRDGQTYANRGLRMTVGPTASGVYLGRLERTVTHADAAEMLAVTPQKVSSAAVWSSAMEMGIILGAPINTIQGTTRYWAMRDTFNDSLGGYIDLPWDKVNVDLVWFAQSGAGDVRWRLDMGSYADGSVAGTLTTGPLITSTAAPALQVEYTRLYAGRTVTPGLCAFRLTRLSSVEYVEDTLNGHAGVVALRFTRAD